MFRATPAASLVLAALLALGCKPSQKEERNATRAAEPSATERATAPSASAPAATPAAIGPVMVPSRRMLLALHVPRPLTAADKKNVEAQRTQAIPEITLEGSTEPHALVRLPTPEEAAPLPEEMIARFSRGLDAAAQKQVASWPGMVGIGVALDKDPGHARLRAFQALALDVAKKRGGYIWDDATRELFSPKLWEETRVLGWEGDLCEMRKHVTIHYYATSGDRHRAITLGMGKVGLPDLVIQDVPPPHSLRAASLINTAAQRLLEGAELTATGQLELDLQAVKHAAAKKWLLESAVKPGRVTIKLTVAAAEEGDPNNRILALDVGSFQGATDGERLGSALDALFGEVPDAPIARPEDDPELAAIAKRVQAKLPELAARVKKGIPLGDSVIVKAPFDTDDGGIEWMWIEVTGFDGTKIKGHLGNTPFNIKGLAAGARVEVEQSKIVDYLWTKADGTTEGGESVKVLEDQMKKLGQ